MFQRNMGRTDRTIRFMIGVILLLTGLFALDGLQGNGTGVIVAAFALLPIGNGAIDPISGSVPHRAYLCQIRLVD